MSSKVNRYDQGRNGMRLDEDGPWVPWDDCAALKSENERLERLVNHWQSLAVFNRKVADAAITQLKIMQGRQKDYDDLEADLADLRAKVGLRDEVRRLREALDTIYHTSCRALNAPRREEE